MPPLRICTGRPGRATGSRRGAGHSGDVGKSGRWRDTHGGGRAAGKRRRGARHKRGSSSSSSGRLQQGVISRRSNDGYYAGLHAPGRPPRKRRLGVAGTKAAAAGRLPGTARDNGNGGDARSKSNGGDCDANNRTGAQAAICRRHRCSCWRRLCRRRRRGRRAGRCGKRYSDGTRREGLVGPRHSRPGSGGRGRRDKLLKQLPHGRGRQKGRDVADQSATRARRHGPERHKDGEVDDEAALRSL